MFDYKFLSFVVSTAGLWISQVCVKSPSATNRLLVNLCCSSARRVLRCPSLRLIITIMASQCHAISTYQTTSTYVISHSCRRCEIVSLHLLVFHTMNESFDGPLSLLPIVPSHLSVFSLPPALLLSSIFPSVLQHGISTPSITNVHRSMHREGRHREGRLLYLSNKNIITPKPRYSL